MYVPPLCGYFAASWADATALQYATAPARAMATRSNDPASRAAGAKTTKTPAPSMDPSPMAVASATPSLRCSCWCLGMAGREPFKRVNSDGIGSATIVFELHSVFLLKGMLCCAHMTSDPFAPSTLEKP